nr:MAG TPA: hypothetical protein [Caudoviricetes sp.]
MLVICVILFSIITVYYFKLHTFVDCKCSKIIRTPTRLVYCNNNQYNIFSKVFLVLCWEIHFNCICIVYNPRRR